MRLGCRRQTLAQSGQQWPKMLKSANISVQGRGDQPRSGDDGQERFQEA